MSEKISVVLPDSGRTQTYRLEAGVPVKFAFDLSEADFTASGNDLVISLSDGRTVVLGDYLVLAGEESLPVFEMLDGQMIPGGVYLFAFGPDFETAAGDVPGGSGAGDYADDPGALGSGLDAMNGQDTLFGGLPPLLFDSTTPQEGEVQALSGQEDVTIYPESASVQIVLNPGFEASSFEGDTWTWLDDVDHWRNTGTTDIQEILPQFRRMMRMSAPVADDDGDSPMETWGPGMDQKPYEGVRLMALDATSDSVDTLSQAIATKAGESVTVSFNFSPYAGAGVEESGMETNDFQVTLGDLTVATITWDADYGAWLVTLGDGVTTADGGTADFYFTNSGYVDGTDNTVTDWTELSFTLTADQDHASLTFSEFSAHDDGYGTLIDAVTAYRDFDSLLVGGESDSFTHAEYLHGTDGDDAIFGSSHSVVDGVGDTYSFAEVIDGGAGDDALYGGQNFLTVISGGEGDDFMVAGRPLTIGVEESHDGSAAVGETFILPGSGNDYVRLGDGSDSIILNREALVDGETLTVENFTVDDGDSLNLDQLFLADGLTVQSSSYSDGDFHLLVGDGSGTIEVTLLGVDSADVSSFVHTGSEADTLNDQIQAIIDSGGQL